MKSTVREPINAFTHLIGAGLAFIGTILLLIQGRSEERRVGKERTYWCLSLWAPF